MGVHDSLRTAYTDLKRSLSEGAAWDYLWFAEQEVDSWADWVSMPLRERLWLYRHGFRSTDRALYDLETHGPAAYVSELQRNRLYRSLNGRQRYLIDDKLGQHWMLADFPEHRPAAHGFVDRGRVHGLAGTTYDGPPVPVAEWLPGALREHGRLVCKQVRGMGGKQVAVCEVRDGQFRLDGDPVSETDLCATVAGFGGYIVTEYVDQHAYADDLYPHASNTIRLLTLWDDAAERLHVPMAIHRIGTERSRPVDNWSLGGLSAEIDVETGRVGPATSDPHGGRLRWHETHPDTGAPIEGVTVPNWAAVRSTVRSIALDNTHVPALGWDVLLDADGDPVVLEANTGTDLDLMQVHRPLLADPDVARVAARHLDGVVPPPGSPDGHDHPAVSPHQRPAAERDED